MVSVYILKLIFGKIYVGKTCVSVYQRFTQHKNGTGSEWTKIYKPLYILKVINDTDDFEEDKQTKKYMSIYGINNVRGGSYSNIKLFDFQTKSLQMEICTSKNMCFRCMKPGHFINKCPELNNRNHKKIHNTERDINIIKLPICNDVMDIKCHNCHDTTHTTLECKDI